MQFQEIFNEPGLYRADSFNNGVGFLIEKCQLNGQNELKGVSYDSVDKLSFSEHPVTIYKGLFDKDYKLVYNKNELFK